MDLTVYHNPRCSKSRQAVQLLQEHGIQPRIVKYLESPPTAAELAAILDKLGMQPRELMRTQEKEYELAGLNDLAMSREALIERMVRYPIVIERPIAVTAHAAVVGRPPEKILEILEKRTK